MFCAQLFENLDDPPGHPPDSEDRHEQIPGYAVQEVHDAGVEVDVDVDPVARIGLHRFVHGLQDLEPLRIAHLPRQPLDAGTHMAGAGVFGLVDAMTEAHDRFAALAPGFDVGRGPGGLTDFLRHLHDVFGGPAVGGSGQRRDRGGHRGMQVGARAGDDAGRER